jgi:tetratricopeptide (TPR) repeat protein
MLKTMFFGIASILLLCVNVVETSWIPNEPQSPIASPPNRGIFGKTEVTPTPTPPYNEIAQAYLTAGKTDIAVNYLIKALEVDPGNTTILRELQSTLENFSNDERLTVADMYYRQGKYQEALDLYLKIADDLPGNQPARQGVENVTLNIPESFGRVFQSEWKNFLNHTCPENLLKGISFVINLLPFWIILLIAGMFRSFRLRNFQKEHLSSVVVHPFNSDESKDRKEKMDKAVQMQVMDWLCQYNKSPVMDKKVIESEKKTGRRTWRRPNPTCSR